MLYVRVLASPNIHFYWLTLLYAGSSSRYLLTTCKLHLILKPVYMPLMTDIPTKLSKGKLRLLVRLNNSIDVRGKWVRQKLILSNWNICGFENVALENSLEQSFKAFKM